MEAAPSSQHRRHGRDLEGKVALITGASRGIGRAVAVNLARRGCSILGTCSSEKNVPLITSISDETSASGSLTDTDGQGRDQRPRVVGLALDIFSPTLHLSLAEALDTHFNGRVDIFVNNACDPMPGVIGAMTPAEVDRSLTANIRNPVLVVDELVKRKMFRPDSRIVYVSSVRSRQPWSEQLMYAAGKSAGESLCRTWSMAFAGREERYAFMTGTTANAVTVGLTQTDSVMMCGDEVVEGFKREFLPLQSFDRMGQPEDVADVISLICSREARWITGSVVSASGGGVKIG